MITSRGKFNWASGGIMYQARKQDELIMRVAQSTRNAVLTGPAAAKCYGLSTLKWVEKVDLLMPGASNSWGQRRSYHDRVYRSARISPEHTEVVNGIRVAQLVRCLFDSYRYYGRLEALVQLESARWKWPGLTEDELLLRTQSLPRAKGLKGFRDLIRYSTSTSQSALETLTRDALLQAIESGRLTGVESIEFQVPFTIRLPNDPPETSVVDILINGFLGIEADGEVKMSGIYGNPVAVAASERLREKRLQNLGLVMFRVGWAEARDWSFLPQLQALLDRYPRPSSTAL